MLLDVAGNLDCFPQVDITRATLVFFYSPCIKEMSPGTDALLVTIENTAHFPVLPLYSQFLQSTAELEVVTGRLLQLSSNWVKSKNISCVLS